MTHPRKNLKLTGDIHPPEVEDDFGPEEGAGAAAAEPAGGEDERAVRIGRSAAGRALRATAQGEGYVEAARTQVRSRPLTAAGVAFFAGFALAVVTRAR